MNLFKKNMKTKTKIMYVVDILLLMLIILNVVTGVLISRTILTSITIGSKGILSFWHHFLASLLAILIIIHVGLHWDFIRNTLRIKKW